MGANLKVALFSTFLAISRDTSFVFQFLENISLFSFNSVDLASFQNEYSQNFNHLKKRIIKIKKCWLFKNTARRVQVRSPFTGSVSTFEELVCDSFYLFDFDVKTDVFMAVATVNIF